jgi:hypothetical protein
VNLLVGTRKRHGGFISYMWWVGVRGVVGVAFCVEHSYGFGLDQYTHLLCHLRSDNLPFTLLTSLLGQKKEKNYGNSNIYTLKLQ